MAFFKFNNVKVVGMAAGVPRHIHKTISTTDKYDDESYIETTGVIESRYSDDFTTADYCEAAANQLIDDLNWERSEIGAIIFVSQTADYILPATSCVLHGKLGLKKECFTLDISLGCSGWVYGLNTLCALMEQGSVKKALLMVGDARGRIIPQTKNHDQLFGYAGTVTALEFDAENTNPIVFDTGSDGTGFEAIITKYGGSRHQISADDFTLYKGEDGRLRGKLGTTMNGMDVFAFGITTAPKSVKKLAKEFEFDYLDADYFIFHQANMKMNKVIDKKLKLPEEKVLYSMPHFGNTSSASIPLTIVTQLKNKTDGHIKLLCCGFGVGLSWATVAFCTDNLVISNLVELGDE